MCKFFVGQRVRIVAADENATPEALATIGREGRITKANPSNGRHSWDWEVDVGLVGDVLYAESECLAPILPDGHRASDYSFSELMGKCREGIAA